MWSAKILSDYENLNLVPENLSEQAGSAEGLGIVHFDSHVSCQSKGGDVTLMVEVGDLFTKIPTTTSMFHFSSSYHVEKLVLTDLRALYTQHYSVEDAPFHLFLTVKLQATYGPLKSVDRISLTDTHLLDYKQWGWKNAGSKALLFTRSSQLLAPRRVHLQVRKDRRRCLMFPGLLKRGTRWAPKNWRAGENCWKKHWWQD